MLVIGPHLSIAKGYLKAAKEALTMGANTFQFFTRNPRGGAQKKFNQQEADDLTAFLEDNHFGPLLAHAPYTLNMASKSEDTRDFAYRCFKEDLERLELLPCNFYNFHPGSHVGDGVETGISRITEILNKVLWDDMHTTVLLECMAGKGSEIGRSFEEIKIIIDRVDLKEKIGVCLDTCHVYSAGYDLKQDLEGVLSSFDTIIGLDRLKAIHLNDSKTDFASNKDRHEKLGIGSIGNEAFIRIINHDKLREIPFYLETPNDNEGYKTEIDFLKTHFKL